MGALFAVILAIGTLTAGAQSAPSVNHVDSSRYTLGLESALNLESKNLPSLLVALRTGNNSQVRFLLDGSNQLTESRDTTDLVDYQLPTDKPNSQDWSHSYAVNLQVQRLLERFTTRQTSLYWGYGLRMRYALDRESIERFSPSYYDSEGLTASYRTSKSKTQYWTAGPQVLLGFHFPFAQHFALHCESRLEALWTYERSDNSASNTPAYKISYLGVKEAPTNTAGGGVSTTRELRLVPLRIGLSYQW